MKISQKQAFPPPFRPARLLPVGSFIAFCRDNGAMPTEGTLERLHKEGLLLPAIKVYRGVTVMKRVYIPFNGKHEWRFVHESDVGKFNTAKVDPKTYYTYGSLSVRRGDWLKWYEERGMTESPVQTRFAKWKRLITDTGYATDPRAFEKSYEYFYDPLQLFVLKFTLKAQGHFQYLPKGERRKCNENLKTRIREMHRFFAFYIEAEQLHDLWYELGQEALRLARQQGYVGTELRQERRGIFEARYLPKLKSNARDIAKRHNFNSEQIDQWRVELAKYTLLYKSRNSLSCVKKYLRACSERALIDAEESTFVIYILNSLLYLLTGERKNVKQIIEDSSTPRCDICGNSFMPIRAGQLTCGDAGCVREHKNKLKRRKRAMLP
ncbi:hypothetical protein A3F52_00845 [Candidatus Uhrbacteria bacterium RIFCSPHIGHO2_12_FULL_47_11]|nr:MAG: hypothetical protein A3F52_00845 [Candidatus Uhrbacteria bacterium RIFCSPHIGHO2_12_FULL_47_11]